MSAPRGSALVVVGLVVGFAAGFLWVRMGAPRATAPPALPPVGPPSLAREAQEHVSHGLAYDEERPLERYSFTPLDPTIPPPESCPVSVTVRPRSVKPGETATVFFNVRGKTGDVYPVKYVVLDSRGVPVPSASVIDGPETWPEGEVGITWGGDVWFNFEVRTVRGSLGGQHLVKVIIDCHGCENPGTCNPQFDTFVIQP